LHYPKNQPLVILFGWNDMHLLLAFSSKASLTMYSKREKQGIKSLRGTSGYKRPTIRSGPQVSPDKNTPFFAQKINVLKQPGPSAYLSGKVFCPASHAALQ
jgi:hypothetical protein